MKSIMVIRATSPTVREGVSYATLHALPNGRGSNLVLSPRSGRWHKAWGGAERNPRTDSAPYLHSPRSGRQRLRAQDTVDMIRLSAAPRALNNFDNGSWGSAPLRPRLYAIGRFAGWNY